MLELIELRFKNIGRFVEEQSINFSELGAFVQVDGQNNNTNGSSGSGKTTVFNSLDYLLGLNDTPATVLQSRLTKEAISVTGTFGIDDEKVTITRSKSLIEFKTEDETLTGKKAEEKIDSLLGMPRDLFRKVIHKRQKEGGFFLELTPSLMHSFLMDCVGLSPFKKKYEIIEARLETLEKTIKTLETEQITHKANLKATQDTILSLGLAPIKDIHEEVIADLKEKYARSTIRFNDVKAKCDADYREFSKNRPDTVNPNHDGTIREGLEKRREEIESIISETFQIERERQEKIRRQIHEKSLERSALLFRIDSGSRAKAEAAKIALEIKSIRASTCPTCLQPWENESSVNSEKSKIAELSKLKLIIDDATKAETEAISLDEEISDLKLIQSPLVDPKLADLNEEFSDVTEKILQDKRQAQEMYDQQSAEIRKRLDDFVFAQGELSKKHSIETDQARGQMDVDRRVYEMAVQKLKSYEEAKERYEKTHNELARKEAIFTKAAAECYEAFDKNYKEQILALESKKAIKTYVSFSFDEALDSIGDKATKIIRCIPNTSNATIQFEGTKETKEGKIKEEVNAVISVDGETGIPIKSLSGGERSAVDLAVDLAVIDYIESKTGKGLNLFILDEPFNGLGTVEIEMALEVLKNSNINKKLTIVDHNPEVKQMVQDRLIVVRDGLTSRMS